MNQGNGSPLHDLAAHVIVFAAGVIASTLWQWYGARMLEQGRREEAARQAKSRFGTLDN